VLSAQCASTCALLRFHELACFGLSLSVQGSEDPIGDFVDLAETVHLDEQAARAVDLEKRRGLIGVDLQAYSDGFLVVVGATIDLCPSEQPRDDFLGVGQE